MKRRTFVGNVVAGVMGLCGLRRPKPTESELSESREVVVRTKRTVAKRMGDRYHVTKFVDGDIVSQEFTEGLDMQGILEEYLTSVLKGTADG